MNKKTKYEKAFTEVNEILRFIPRESYNKIPQKFIKYMLENSSDDYKFEYNHAIPFEEQKISETSKKILGLIFRLFIIEDEKKKELNKKDNMK